MATDVGGSCNTCTMDPEQATALGDRIKQLRAQSEEARVQRDAAIRVMREQGVHPRDIAETFGITMRNVYFILSDKPRSDRP